MDKEIIDAITEAAVDKILPYQEITAALITSATSIRNTDCITRAMYAQIDAQLKACREYINANNSQFTARMKERDYILKVYRDLLDSLRDLLPHSSEETAAHCTKLMDTIILQMSEIGINGPDIIRPPRF